MLINHTSKQVTAKIVYYGPGLGGKTTNLQHIFSVTNPRSRGELVSMETEIERTLFFDLLPMNVGMIKGYQTKFQLYTVPGQVFYDSTRRLVLKGADGIVFVADSQELMEESNCESLQNLKDNLLFYQTGIEDIPLVFQFNKRDLKNVLPIERLNYTLNPIGRPHVEAVARKGRGVIETLREISTSTLIRIKETLEHMDVTPDKVTVQFDLEKGVDRQEAENSSPGGINLERTEETAGRPEPAEEQPAREKEAVAVLAEKNGDGSTWISATGEIEVKESAFSVEVKDASGCVLKTLGIQLNPDTNQVRITFDVKR
jgi:signal recognition particle receptor subunit beta